MAANNPWLALDPSTVTQKSLNSLPGQQMPLGFTPYYNTPEGQAEMQQLEDNRKLAAQQQQEGVAQYEDLLKQHLARTQNDPKIDLSPLMAFADTLYGSNLAQNYRPPQNSKAALETTAALQQGLQKAKGALTESDQNLLLTKMKLRQQADADALKALSNMYGLESQDKRAADKLAAKQAENGGLNLTPGQKALDVAFAKDANEWTSNGKNNVVSNLTKLEEAAAELEKFKDDPLLSGRIVGNLPDIARSNRSKALQQKVNQAVVGGIKAALGSSFTEKENINIQRLSYDPTLAPEDNLAKIKAAIEKIKADAANEEAKVKHFTANKGTLSGYTGPSTPSVAPPVENAPLTREQKIELLKARQAGGQ